MNRQGFFKTVAAGIVALVVGKSIKANDLITVECDGPLAKASSIVFVDGWWVIGSKTITGPTLRKMYNMET